MHEVSFLEIGLIGFLAQIIDGTLGMGYGVTSSTLLISLGIPPAIASAGVHTSLVLIGSEKFRWDLVFALLIGGVIAAPIAAFTCKKFPKRILGILVGLIVIILSLRMILKR